jgi:hypothetical protein
MWPVILMMLFALCIMVLLSPAVGLYVFRSQIIAATGSVCTGLAQVAMLAGKASLDGAVGASKHVARTVWTSVSS